MPPQIFTLAIAKAQQLPDADQERIGRELSEYIDALSYLPADIEQGLRSLDAGLGRELDIEAVIARTRANFQDRKVTIFGSPESEVDLLTIWRWSAGHFLPGIAAAHLRSIKEAAVTLQASPFLGQRRDDLKPGIRATVVYPTVLLYRVTTDRVEIVRVVDGRCNFQAGLSHEIDI